MKHFFISSAQVHLPHRLQEAFADIHAVGITALLAFLAGETRVPCLVWVSDRDPDWERHLEQIMTRKPDARVVVLSSTPNPAEGLRALNEGAHGYTHAYAVPELLQEVALVVGHGGLWVGAELMQRLVGSTHKALSGASTGQATPPGAADSHANPWKALSAREVEVARAVLAGRCNKEVAAMLFISERTVKAHLGAIFEKLGVRDRLQLVLQLAAAPVST